MYTYNATGFCTLFVCKEVVSVSTTTTVSKWNAHQFGWLESPTLEISSAGTLVRLFHADNLKNTTKFGTSSYIAFTLIMDTEHSPFAVAISKVQSDCTSQGLCCTSSIREEQSSCIDGSTISSLVLILTPLPHDALHGDQSDQSDT